VRDWQERRRKIMKGERLAGKKREEKTWKVRG
jgi:hypothetical protein